MIQNNNDIINAVLDYCNSKVCPMISFLIVCCLISLQRPIEIALPRPYQDFTTKAVLITKALLRYHY